MSTAMPSRPRQTGQRRSFTIVASQYNGEFVRGLVEHAQRELESISASNSVSVFEVPGAFEIPLLVQEIAARGNTDAIIALGVIIEGETQHAALICAAVTDALMRAALTHRVPVIHEVLLVKNAEQAKARCLGEDINRGTDAARAASAMLQTLSAFHSSR